ncbi:hypothetical protein EYM_03710 [Ignicoccus islandicus DSM 13165]|uniref:NADH:quinone oxidoreductase/Mrp antiporter transmembrane domain-containing protein n=1 Tax=Ignicoccus islandicus DSM 13165 TaxID=940295 RepID=A0A0U2VEK0_9CREN|nr:proton-conducting transporter membrane subunit [Ignicoccus islandicus]ALU12434.1 hypothetical protein EYM_03710 [Ignicoccus islandicus DSM 13165]
MIDTMIVYFLAVLQSIVFPVYVSKYLSSILLLVPLLFGYSKLGSLVLDSFTKVGMLAVTLPAVVTLLFHRRPQRHFVILITLLTISGQLVAASRNLATLAVALEAMSLAAAAVALYPGSRDKLRVSTTYLIFSVMAAIMLFLGLALYFAGGGSIQLTNGFTQTSTAIVGLALMVAAIMIKLAITPMHAWAVDVYSEGSTSAALYLSSSVKAGAMIALAILAYGPLRYAYELGYWQLLLPFLLLATLSNVVGAVGMVATTKVKRILSFSSVAHAGFVALTLAYPTQLTASVIAYYALVYSIANTVAFSSVLMVKAEDDATVNELSLLYKKPLTALAVAIAVLSLLGLPPTAGFNAKLFSLLALFHSSKISPWLLTTFAIIAVVSTAISGYSYIKIVGYLSKKPEDRSDVRISSIDVFSWILALLLLVMYFVPVLSVPTI